MLATCLRVSYYCDILHMTISISARWGCVLTRGLELRQVAECFMVIKLPSGLGL